MRKTKKLAAVMAVALGVGITPYANAVIELKHNGTGDVVMFPVFNGYVENYFTISNNSNSWVQGHLRFRGAAFSTELRDFDVILSPGDVFVFRVADLNGDKVWEIDQSLDPKNFQYTGQLVTNPSDVRGCPTSSPTTPCMGVSPALNPAVGGSITQDLVDHNRRVGYIEFIGEAVLDGMTHQIMNELISKPGTRDSNCANIFNHQTKFFSGLGTNAWMWSHSDTADYIKGRPGTCDRGLSDVPNVLSGTAFITIPGASMGIAYNAEVLTNFRTAVARPADDDIYAAGGANGTFPYVGATPATKSSLGTSSTIPHAEGEHRIDNYLRNSRLRFGTAGIPGIAGTGTTAAHPNEKGDTTIINLDAEDRAVILHNETSGAAVAKGITPFGDYVYEYVPFCAISGITVEDDFLECRISFNNTWGPTLLDGDDYFLGIHPGFNDGHNVYGGTSALRIQSTSATRTSCSYSGAFTTWDNCDDFDARYISALNVVNSLAEVEEAIRIGGQNFFAYYFDNAPFDESAGGGQASLTSYYFAYFPTKFYWAENASALATTTRESYVTLASRNMLGLFAKPLAVEVWDIFENSGGQSTEGCISPDPCGLRIGLALGHELNFFPIGFLKSPFGLEGATGYQSGRVVISPGGNSNAPTVEGTATNNIFPGLFYTFELDSNVNLGHWRSMQRGQ
jgi:hypothetical protein